ncbi:MAG: XRE family transcriptional regulator [Acidimicrobiales bacterium]
MTEDEETATTPWEQVVAEDQADPAYRAAVEAAALRQQRQSDAYRVTLAELRKAQALTQVQLARSLGITQAEVSRIEHQADVLLSTLASYITAAGGTLHLLVEFADREPVVVDLDALRLSQVRAGAGSMP